MEADFLARFSKVLTPADHKCRLDRLLIADPRSRSIRHSRVNAANRLLPQLDEAERLKAHARIKVFASRGGRGGRAGRGGRGRGRGRGGPAASVDERGDLPSVPRLPPEPPIERLRPLRVSASADWVRAGGVPRRLQWADVPREQRPQAQPTG